MRQFKGQPETMPHTIVVWERALDSSNAAALDIIQDVHTHRFQINLDINLEWDLGKRMVFIFNGIVSAMRDCAGSPEYVHLPCFDKYTIIDIHAAIILDKSGITRETRDKELGPKLTSFQWMPTNEEGKDEEGVSGWMVIPEFHRDHFIHDDKYWMSIRRLSDEEFTECVINMPDGGY